MIYLVGERLNSSVPSTGKAMLGGDFEALKTAAEAQAEAGASCLDINTALCGEKEKKTLSLLASMAVKETNCDVMLDSPSPEAIISALPATAGRYAIINSVTADERLAELIPAAVEYGAGVVGLPILSGAIPDSAEGRLKNALIIREKLSEAGIPDERIYIDVLAESVATNPTAGRVTLETARLIRKTLPAVHLICGLSNVSFGLPKRVNINSAAAALLAEAGVDCFIANAASSQLKTALAAEEAYLGKDEYCIEYINHMRSQK